MRISRPAWRRGHDRVTGSREHRLAEAFVTLADTLVTDFDVADLFHDLAGVCVELLEVTAAGLMLVDVSGRLRVMSSSSERSACWS
jgi:hypothetical protein